MQERVQDLESRLAAMAEALRQIEGRVGALERVAQRGTTAERPAAVPGPAQAEEADVDAAVGKLLPLGGRTLLVLAGAFVLRALTDLGTIPVPIGVGLGLAYAGTWILMAERAGRARALLSSGFHGVAAVAIGFPLLFEAASKFHLLSPVLAAALLAMLTAVALGIASARRLQALAWVVGLGGTITALALMAVAGGHLTPGALYLVLLGVATLWLGYVRDWVYLRWPIAIVADLVAVLVAVSSTGPGAVEGPGAAFLVQAALLGLYLGSIATRTLFLQRKVVPFELVQTAAALAVGLGGAVFVAARSGIGWGGFGVVSVLFGVATYAVAFAFVERRQKIRTNFYFYSSVAIVFVLAGTGLVLSPRALPLAWAVLGVAAAWLARRRASSTLSLHAVAYAIGAALAAGLGSGSIEAAFVGSNPSWVPSWSSVLVVLGMVAAAWLTASVPRESLIERIPRFALIAVLAASAAGLIIGELVPFLGTTSANTAGAVATIRTGVLVAGAILLARLGCLEAWREARWLVYPVLAITGLKILVEDLPRSKPATLFLTFAFYGAALILVPRMRPRAAPVPGQKQPGQA
ncbi:MAG TPA: hypothetical protein VMK12_00380 [Anaeromyxobacteraceae bacterium]|nr:hypothetical protein [Anaeromyxobacteraceae bacterium]